MRLEKVRIRNLGPFRDLSLDLADYADAKLIAVTGENGAGKSTLLELAVSGACYRYTPTRGTLTELSTARDSMLEVTLVNGSRHTIRHLVDGISGKSEALVLDDSGKPELPDAKVRSHDSWAAKHLPSPEVLFASIFGAQGADGFLGMKPAERKSVLLRCLGIEKFERLAEQAREHAKASKSKIETLEARMGDERARAGDAEALARALSEATERAAAADALVEETRAAVETARQEAARITALAAEAEVVRAQRAELEQKLTTACEAVADVSKRLAACRAIIAESAQIRGAAARISEIDAELARLAAESTQRQSELAQAESELGAAREQLAAVRREKRSIEERVTRLTERLADESKVSRASAVLPERAGVLADARADFERLDHELNGLRDQRLSGADERIGSLRKGLQTVVAAAGETSDARVLAVMASKPLDDDDETVRLAAELPAKVAVATRAHSEARGSVGALEREVSDLERLAARAPEFAAVRAELADAKAAIADAAKRETAADERVGAAHNACEPLRTATAPITIAAGGLRAERETLVAIAGKAELLAKAEALVDERCRQLDAAETDVSRLVAALESATPALEPPSPAPDIAAFSRRAAEADTAARAAHSAVAVAAQHQEQGAASAARLAALGAERAGLDDELADWSRLAADLGKDGLQAQLIDAAIPELNHVGNELLHQAFGPRFTVDVRTQALDSKGKRTLETLDVVVIDTVNGREALAETYSGGERVVIQEALSLALTVLACRQNGVDRPTLIRDESGAALSEGRAPQWIAMLRRAVDIIGAKQCLFVSHTPATWELADARIHLGAEAT